MSSYVDTLQIYERLKVANLEEDAAKEIAEIFKETTEDYLGGGIKWATILFL